MILLDALGTIHWNVHFIFQLVLRELSWMPMRSLSPCLEQFSWGESLSQSITAESWLINCSSFLPLPCFWPLCFTSWRKDYFHFCDLFRWKEEAWLWGKKKGSILQKGSWQKKLPLGKTLHWTSKPNEQ